MRIKKISVLAVCLLCAMILSGSIFRSAEIVTWNGEPLIDLDALIHSTELGQEGSENKGELVDPITKPGEGNDDTGNNNEKQDTPVPEKSYVINVSDNVITCGGYTFIYMLDKKAVIAKGIKSLDEVLKDASGKEIIISDNYAEAHALRFMIDYVKKILGENTVITIDPDYGTEWGVTK